MMSKTRVAVLFGGRSPEHDVSIVSGLQALNALDSSKYEGFPVYIAGDGAWFTGDALRNRANYIPDEEARKALTRVDLDLSAGKGQLIPRGKGGFFAKKTLHKVIVMLGENRYTLEDPGRGPLLASRTRIVRGIALKTESIPVETWVQELGAALDERARSSATAREALARLIG